MRAMLMNIHKTLNELTVSESRLNIEELSFLKYDEKWCLAIIRDGAVQVLRNASRSDRVQVFIDGSVARLIESIPQQLRDELILREQAQEAHKHVNRLLNDLKV
jgi:hypothetical protein